MHHATPHLHLFDLPVRIVPPGSHARIVEGCFDDGGKLNVRGIEDISDTELGRRVLSAPEFAMEPRIERVYLGPHPGEQLEDDEFGTVAESIKRGAAWLLNEHEGIRLLIPVPRSELRRFEV